MSEVLDVEIVALGERPTDDEVAAIAALSQTVQDDDRPDDPPLSLTETAGRLRTNYPQHESLHLVARRGGEVVGRLSAYVDRRPTNAGFAELEEVEVHPLHRRRGVALALVRTAVATLADRDARTIMSWPHDDAGRQLCERIGLTMRQLERQSRMVVAEVDLAMLAEWTEAPKARANGYQVHTFCQPVPDELVGAWIEAKDAMADAPLDDVEWAHQPTTVEWVRAVEAMHRERGTVGYGAVAVDRDGNGAGMSWILMHPDRPQLAHQEDMAVVPAHRGHGLGRWLKSANFLQLLDAVPGVEIVETYNAESNGPMLDINVAMGFRPSRTYYAYQGDLSAVVAALDS